MIYGKNTILELLKSENTPVTEIQYLRSIKVDEKVNEIFSLSERLGIKISQVNQIPVDQSNRNSGPSFGTGAHSSVIASQKRGNLQQGNNQTHQNIFALVKPYNYFTLDDILQSGDQRKRIVILDHLQDQANLGSIIRSAAAFNFNYIIIPKDRSVEVNDTTYKIASGAINNVKIVKVTNLNNAIQELKNDRVFVIGFDGSAKSELQELDYDDESLAIVMGSESDGISHLTHKHLDQVVKINYNPEGVESLNVAVAASIGMYQLQ
jgi:23S rRNA (guanosine2251-2'-O)-methyltransferase